MFQALLSVNMPLINAQHPFPLLISAVLFKIPPSSPPIPIIHNSNISFHTMSLTYHNPPTLVLQVSNSPTYHSNTPKYTFPYDLPTSQKSRSTRGNCLRELPRLPTTGPERTTSLSLQSWVCSAVAPEWNRLSTRDFFVSACRESSILSLSPAGLYILVVRFERYCRGPSVILCLHILVLVVGISSCRVCYGIRKESECFRRELALSQPKNRR